MIWFLLCDDAVIHTRHMSAPPRSQIQVAPNRKGGAVVRISIPGVLQQSLDWKQYILDFCEMDTWDNLEFLENMET